MAEGEGSSRNFRSTYYEKLGFCGNEEKNILDLLIASSPFDLEKLSDLCDRFDLDRRCIEAWKVILGVECGRKNPFDEFANVRRIRAEHFHSLKHHLDVLLRHHVINKGKLNHCNVESSTPDTYKKAKDDCHQELDQEGNHKNLGVFIDQVENRIDKQLGGDISSTNGRANDVSKSEDSFYFENVSNKKGKTTIIEEVENNPGKQITLMYLLEVGRLDSLDIRNQLDTANCRKLSAMASFFVNVSEDLQEAFFLFRNFTRKLEENEATNKTQIG